MLLCTGGGILNQRMKIILLSWLLLLPAVRQSTPGTLTVTDDLGHALSLPGIPRRIVSLAPSLTESLYAIGAGDQVVGVTDYCDYPPDARKKPRVGGMINPNLETIISVHPDLVIMSVEGNQKGDYERLTSLGVPVFISNPRSLEGIYRSLAQLGGLTGKTRAASRVIDSLRAVEDSVRALPHGPPVASLMLVSVRPLMAAGKGTFLNELLVLAGGRNIAGGAASGYPAISRETILADNPHVILATSDIVTSAPELLSLFPEWAATDAARRGRVFVVDANLVTRPGPRALEGLRLLSGIIHGAQAEPGSPRQ